MGWLPKGLGEYPPEYNREVHGPYNPSVYYGKRDTPFSEVKLGELGAWIRRRDKSPRSMARAISRTWFRYLDHWVHPMKASPAYIYHIFFFISSFWFIVRHKEYYERRSARYH